MIAQVEKGMMASLLEQLSSKWVWNLPNSHI